MNIIFKVKAVSSNGFADYVVSGRSYGQLESHMDSAHFVSLNILTKDFEFIKTLYTLEDEASG